MQRNDARVPEAKEIVLPPVPVPSLFFRWRMKVRSVVANASSVPEECMRYLTQIDNAKSWADIQTLSKFRALEQKFARALKKLYEVPRFLSLKDQIETLESHLSESHRLLSGSQIAWFFWQQCTMCEGKAALED